MERMCRAAGIEPASRGNVKGHEIFVADGFSKSPGVNFRKFGASLGDGPSFVTIWFASKGLDTLDIGRALFFEKGNEGGKRGRINAALKDAKESIEARDRAREQLTSSLRLN